MILISIYTRYTCILGLPNTTKTYEVVGKESIQPDQC